MADEQLRQYLSKVYPVAQQIEGKTGIPAPILAAMMSWETNIGTNQTTKYKNELGIKYVGQSQATGGKVAGMYAGYNSYDDFASDVARILGLGAYGYPEIISTAKNNPSQWGDIIRAWNRSSWAEADYSVEEIVRRAYVARDVSGLSIVSGGGGSGLALPELPNLSDLGRDDLLKYAGVGVLVVAALKLAAD